jgi:tryptophan halogenase
MKIVIVGGGTAGWLSAYFINKSLPNVHDVTIIESSSLGIIGAGEGSTGLMVDLLNGAFFNYKVDIDKFLAETGGTKKFGIKHINWSPNNTTYFAPLDVSPTAFESDDYILKHVLSNNLNTHLASKVGIEYENGIFTNTYAMHFDGHKVGNFFKNICVNEHNNKVIDSVVSKVTLNKDGFVDSLLLENNEIVCGDIFIDCTGFQRKISSAVGTKWVSYSDVLPLNTAMPFTVNNNKNIKLDPVTKAHALSSGWMWEIPLQERVGMGYVFDKNFISIEDAKLEVEKYLGTKINPIKVIDFNAGHVDKFWNKNVINFGLSSSFVEPLEATSIHNTIVQLYMFVKEFLSTGDKNVLLSTSNQDKYNNFMVKLNKLTIDFISIHYQGNRNDTAFWRGIQKNKIISEGAKEYVEACKTRIPSFLNLFGMFGSYSIPLANWIGAGIGLLNPNIAKQSLIDSTLLKGASVEHKKFYAKTIEDKKYIHYL